jgi:hypothetical protein
VQDKGLTPPRRFSAKPSLVRTNQIEQPPAHGPARSRRLRGCCDLLQRAIQLVGNHRFLLFHNQEQWVGLQSLPIGRLIPVCRALLRIRALGSCTGSLGRGQRTMSGTNKRQRLPLVLSVAELPDADRHRRFLMIFIFFELCRVVIKSQQQRAKLAVIDATDEMHGSRLTG